MLDDVYQDSENAYLWTVSVFREPPPPYPCLHSDISSSEFWWRPQTCYECEWSRLHQLSICGRLVVDSPGFTVKLILKQELLVRWMRLLWGSTSSQTYRLYSAFTLLQTKHHSDLLSRQNMTAFSTGSSIVNAFDAFSLNATSLTWIDYLAELSILEGGGDYCIQSYNMLQVPNI